MREAWRGNDGAEGESVKLICDELERLRALDLRTGELEKTNARQETVSALLENHAADIRGLLLNECHSSRQSSQLTRQLKMTSALTLWQRLMDAERDQRSAQVAPVENASTVMQEVLSAARRMADWINLMVVDGFQNLTVSSEDAAMLKGAAAAVFYKGHLVKTESAKAIEGCCEKEWCPGVDRCVECPTEPRRIAELEAQLRNLAAEREALLLVRREANTAWVRYQEGQALDAVMHCLRLRMNALDALREAKDSSPSGQKAKSNDQRRDRGDHRSGFGKGPRELDADEARRGRDDAQAGERRGADGPVSEAERSGEGSGPRDGQDGVVSGGGIGPAEVATGETKPWRWLHSRDGEHEPRCMTPHPAPGSNEPGQVGSAYEAQSATLSPGPVPSPGKLGGPVEALRGELVAALIQIGEQRFGVPDARVLARQLADRLERGGVK